MERPHARYRYVKVPGCPIAPPSGRLPLHRLILFAKIGPGPHPCFRCERLVNWSDTVTAADALTVNHMDNNPDNNAWDNLEPSCHSCNVAHGRDERFHGGLFIREGNKRHRAVERTCQRGSCGRIFLVRLTQIESAARKGKVAGRYCSPECMWARNR